MKRVLAVTTVLASLCVPAAAQATAPLELNPLGRTAALGEAGAEITAFDPRRERAFTTNSASNSLDIYDFRDPRTPALERRVPLAPFGGGPNSVDVSRAGIVAVAVEANVKTDPGTVQFFDTRGERLCSVRTGALPDMLTFTRDGKRLLVANEGEPSDDGAVDPEGSVTIVDLRRGPCRARTSTANFDGVPLRGDVRTFVPGASVQQDLEPEYITVEGDRAYVSLQENNAIGVLDLRRDRFSYVRGLGYKNHGQRGNAFDPSDRDGGIAINPWKNVFGMYQPDAVASYTVRGKTYVVTANEGDARDYPFFAEEARAGELALDPKAFPGGEAAPSKLGRLTVTTTQGDEDGDGDYEKLYAFGGRSLSVLDADARMRFDTGSALEDFVARFAPGTHNLDNSLDSPPDNRSDNKGPEPEGVDVGRVGGRNYAFLGAERQGGIFALDLDDRPGEARLAGYVNTRPADLGPEGILFVSADDSPTGRALLLVTSEVSGTVTSYELRRRR